MKHKLRLVSGPVTQPIETIVETERDKLPLFVVYNDGLYTSDALVDGTYFLVPNEMVLFRSDHPALAT